MSPLLQIWTLTLISGILNAASAVAVDQKVLKPANSDLTELPLDERLDRFYLELQDLVIHVKPAFASCYHNPGPWNESQCESFTAKGLKTNDIWTEDQPGGYFYGNWASCQARGETCAIPLSTTASVPDTRTCFDGEVPPRMVNVTSVDQIQRAVKSAAELQLPILVKNTGHDWKGRSSGINMATIWTHHLRSPLQPPAIESDFTPVGCEPSDYAETVFHFAGGEIWGKAYNFADEHNLTVVGGTCPSVGLAGWLQGGGHSPITPVFGMGVDNVRQVEIVLANGTIATASGCLNEQLYRAIRGGGGGTWGVVTNITYKAIPKLEIKELSANITSIAKNDETMQQFFDIVTSNATTWARHGWGGYVKTNISIEIVNANPDLSLDDAKADMQALVDFLNQHDPNIRAEVTTVDSWFKYFKENLEPATAHPAGKAGAVASRLIPRGAFETQRTEFADNLFKLHTNANISQVWLMLVTPTMYPHTNTSALHPTWKDAVWSVRISRLWDPYLDWKADTTRAFFEDVHEAMEPLRGLFPKMGVSLNEADIWEENAGEAFWGQNYASLQETKKEVDPFNLFTNWDAVGWDRNEERYSCYPKPDSK